MASSKGNFPIFQTRYVYALPNATTTTIDTASSGKFDHAALYVGGAGNVDVVTAGGQAVTFSGVAAGTFLPVVVRSIVNTSTATSVLALCD